MSVERLGIVDAAQGLARRFAERHPAQAWRILGKRPEPTPVPSAPICASRASIATLARVAVDAAIAEAISREVALRRADIENIATLNYRPPLDLPQLLELVCEVSGQRRESLAGMAGARPVSSARHLFWYIGASLRRDLALSEVGRFLGNRGHSTVFRALQSFAKTRHLSPLKEWCEHAEISALLAEADKHPRVS